MDLCLLKGKNIYKYISLYMSSIFKIYRKSCVLMGILIPSWNEMEAYVQK